jgi:3-oxoacyl-[acyl-carrier protein] reductase
MGLLDARTAVITGGAQGLGYAIAEAFVKEGANVVLGDLNAEGVVAAAEQLDVGNRAVRTTSKPWLLRPRTVSGLST